MRGFEAPHADEAATVLRNSEESLTMDRMEMSVTSEFDLIGMRLGNLA